MGGVTLLDPEEKRRRPAAPAVGRRLLAEPFSAGETHQQAALASDVTAAWFVHSHLHVGFVFLQPGVFQEMM